MRIDYAASVSEVYQYVVKYIINRDRNLDTLCILLTYRAEISSDLPTWVPDWRVPTSTYPLKVKWEYFARKYGASGFTEAVRQDQKCLGRLRDLGHHLDTIDGVAYTQTFEPDHLPDNYIISVRSFVPGKDVNVVATTKKCPDFILPPKGSRQGDDIFIIKGAKMPIVLRLHNSEFRKPDADGCDGSEWEVVGPCWFLNFMWGKAMTHFEIEIPLQLTLV